MNEQACNRVCKCFLLGLFGATVLALGAGGRWFYRNEVQAVRSNKELELKTIARLKKDQIVEWRRERVSDARVHSRRALLRSAVAGWSSAWDDPSFETEVRNDIDLIRTSCGYKNVIVVGRDGRMLFSLAPGLRELEAEAKQLAAQALSSPAPVFGDSFRCPTCNEVHLDVAARILDQGKRPAGVLILRSDPEQDLYPLVQSWPTPSRSAETLLIRRDGDDVLFLNKLRHVPDAAMTLRIPISRIGLPAVQAALGRTGMVEGHDYRGVEVLAEILPVPGSSWFLVAKVDTEEILAEARQRGQYIFLLTALLVLVNGAGVAVVFNFRQKTLYRNLYRAEHQRRQVEEEIRAAFYSIGDGVISADAAGRITRMNPVAEKLTGWSEAEALKKPLEEVFCIVNEERRTEVENPVSRLVHEGVVVGLANHILLTARDGSERPIANSGAPIRSEEGEINGVVLVFRDQTDERRAETLLRQSEERFRILVENARDVVARILPDATVDYCSPVVTAFGGYTPEEMIGQPIGKYCADPQQSQRALAILAEVIETREGCTVEFLYQPKAGAPFWVEVSGEPIIENDEVTAIHCILRDITGRKQAEEALRERREQLQCIVSAAQDAIIMIDVQGCISLWNQSAERVFGYSAEEALGRHLHRLLVPARFHETYVTDLAEFGRSGKGFTMGKVIELPALHKNGSEFPVELSLSPVRLHGQPHLVGIVRDITEREQVQQRLRTYAAALKSANQRLRRSTRAAKAATRAKSEFLAKMSHEIRTPMTSILGYTDLLADDSLSAADRKSFLATVRRNGEHLLQLINDILDLSKIEAGKMVMELGPCHLPSVVADVASMMRPRAEQRGNTLEVCCAGPLPGTIHTDGNRLHQVLVNLVGNAVKFTENGSIRIGVSFLPQWRSNQPAVSVAVTDTGIGIRPEVLSRLFKPFARGESLTNRKYGGTGLGLVISRQLVTALGGELMVESVPGKGSTFTVTIPAGDISGVDFLQSGEAICEDEARTRPKSGGGVLEGVRILLAEDSIDNQELVRAVLGNVGAEVEAVENGSLAVERARTDNFDVVLMDMNMPEMEGYEATRRLRDGGYQRPILALTANAMAGDRERCLAAGCDAHLAKPFDRKRLEEMVAQYAVSETSQTDAPTASASQVVPSGQRDGIASQFADDRDVADLLPRFVERLPGQLDALCEALEEERLEDIQRLAHRLKGAGGSYGYPTLSEVAKSLELAAKARDVGGAVAALAGVKEVCAAIQTGWTGDTAEAGQS